MHDQDLSDQVPVVNAGFWREVWSLEVPSKVKNFVWRACKEALPTKANFCRRRILPEAICENCKAENEDVSYAIFFLFFSARSLDIRPLIELDFNHERAAYARNFLTCLRGEKRPFTLRRHDLGPLVSSKSNSIQ